MRQFFSFVKKEFCHILRDTRTMIILLGMPVALIIIFGFALSNEVKNAEIAVVSYSKDMATASIIQKINASRYFDVKKILKSANEIDEEFKSGNIKMAIVFPSGFAKSLHHFNKVPIQLIADASNPNIAGTLINYATAIIMDYQHQINDRQPTPYSIQTEIHMLYNPQLKGSYSFVPGVMAMVLMLVCTMMTAITIVKEKETGTMEVLLVSPVSPYKIILAKAVPYALLSIINIVTILILSVYVLHVPINGSITLLVAVSILFTLTSLSLGLLISSITDSQQTAMFISLVGLFLPTILLSGFMFPIENMPLPLRILSNIVPAKWYYTIVKSVMIKGIGFSVIWKEALVLSGMMVFFLILSIRTFKIRLA